MGLVVGSDEMNYSVLGKRVAVIDSGLPYTTTGCVVSDDPGMKLADCVNAGEERVRRNEEQLDGDPKLHCATAFPTTGVDVLVGLGR
jgi:hypothetical protein